MKPTYEQLQAESENAKRIADALSLPSAMPITEIGIALATARLEARNKALEDAAAVAYDKIEDCEHADAGAEWYKGYASACRGIAGTICAMKSSE